MKREKAADLLQEILDRWYAPTRWLFTEKCAALEMAIAALRGSEWVRAADRLPTEANEGEYGCVVVYDPELDKDSYADALDGDWGYAACLRAKDVSAEFCPYWLPLPKLPEVEG